MARDFFDRSLLRLQGLACGLCNRADARATGRLCEMPAQGRWKLEVECPHCQQSSLVWAPDDARVRRVLDEHAEPVAPAVPAPQPAVDGPLLLDVLDAFSARALAMGRDCRLTVTPTGRCVHDIVPGNPKFASMQLGRVVEAAHVLEPLSRLTAALRRGDLPPALGRGPHRLVLTPAFGHPLAIHGTQHPATREFGADPRVTREIVDLVDGVRALVAWIDAGGPEPAWPATDAPRSFPRPDDLLRATPALRLSSTTFGGGRHHDVHELWIAATGETERRTLDGGVEKHSERSTLAPPAVRRMFAALVALDPRSFRGRVGFVRKPPNLDWTFHHTLAWFDGTRVAHTTLVFASENPGGLDFGDAPPAEAEAAAFRLLGVQHLGPDARSDSGPATPRRRR